jgi:hypothetical protein
MSKQSLAVIAAGWVAGLIVATWMFATDQQGPILSGLISALGMMPILVGLEIWRAKKRG